MNPFGAHIMPGTVCLFGKGMVWFIYSSQFPVKELLQIGSRPNLRHFHIGIQKSFFPCRHVVRFPVKTVFQNLAEALYEINLSFLQSERFRGILEHSLILIWIKLKHGTWG